MARSNPDEKPEACAQAARPALPSEHLRAYLAQAQLADSQFSASQWLETLGDEALLCIRRWTRELMNGDINAENSDIFKLVTIATEAQTIRRRENWSVNDKIPLIGTLYIAASTETCRRLGWLTLAEPIYLTPGATLRGSFNWSTLGQLIHRPRTDRTET